MKVLVDISEEVLKRMKLVSKVSSVDGVCQAVLDGTVLDNMSNGEVFKAMFPNGVESNGRTNTYYSFDWGHQIVRFEIKKDWWNAPYAEKER